MIEELRPGLYRWTARHPAWRPGARSGSPDDWDPDDGCVAYAVSGGLVVVDPLVPAGAEDAFWAELDELVAAHGPAVTVLTTIRFHRRSGDAVVARYGAQSPPIDEAAIAGVQTLPIPDADETMVWLPGVRALVPGDRLLGSVERPGVDVRPCPASWLRYIGTGLDEAGLRERLRVLLALDVELILVSHGAPVLRDGRAAIERALRPD